MSRGLVLAGGGVAGIAWELGVLRGIADADPALAERIVAADIVVGTSAGSSVGAQITGGAALDALYQAQLTETSTEIEVDVDLPTLIERWTAATFGEDGQPLDAAEARRRMGALALATETVDEAARLVAVAARLPRPEWPERVLLIPAVDALTGELVVFSRESGVPLVEAVAASCAVPGVWPPVTIGARRFVDGGIRSMTNADLAAGADRVLILVPSLAGAPQLAGNLDDETAAFKSLAIWADEASIAAFGANPLSPSTRGPAARAGREVGRAQAGAVAAFWT